MARYRKIDIRMWGDREVLRLSRPQPNGQSLWVYLLAGPATGIVPGAYRVREGGLADELGWSVEAFREAFREVNGEAFRYGLAHGAEKPLAKADWEAGMVWVPKGIKHNPPQSMNVVSSWREAWDELPECELKREAYQGLRAFVEGMSKGFLKAFDEAIPKPSWKPSPKACRIQEQDQEQDQEGEAARARAIPVPLARPRSSAPTTPTTHPEGEGERRSNVAVLPTRASQNFTAPPAAVEAADSCTSQLWAVWQELASVDPATSPSKQAEGWLGSAWVKLVRREPRESEALWRRMVSAFVASKRDRGLPLELRYVAVDDFDKWAEYVARETSQSNGVTARPEYQPYDFGDEVLK